MLGWLLRRAAPSRSAKRQSFSLASGSGLRALIGRYDAAVTSDDNRRHWAHADGLSANAANSADVRRTLRNRSRYEVANNSYARGIVLTLANDVVGTGPRLQLLTPDSEANRQIELAFMQWAKAVGLPEKLRTMRAARATDGEAFAILTSNPSLQTDIQLDLRLVEADQVCTPDLNPLAQNSVDGIVFDTWGNPIEYHVLHTHPGDGISGPNREYHRIPAGSVVHWYRADRPGQRRNRSRTAAVPNGRLHRQPDARGWLALTNQHDARREFRSNHFDYVLLDLQIPAKPNGGRASNEFGINLLRQITRTSSPGNLPVIIMAADPAEVLDLSGKLRTYGATDFVAKPLGKTGRSLAKVIVRALDSALVATKVPGTARQAAERLAPFSGGAIVFRDRHVELLGTKIVSCRGNARSVVVLRALAKKDLNGRFVRMSAEELARAIGRMAGANAVTAGIQTLRRNASARLQVSGMTCGRDDVIAHTEQGYYLREWITIGDADPAVRGSFPTNDGAATESKGPPDRPSNAPAQRALNPRQEWVLRELESGTVLRRLHVERHFRLGNKTAKRDLSQLVAKGMIEYVRQGREGYYRILTDR